MSTDSSSGERRENRLGRETSPYLRLHRHNPVDWYPWGEEAFARAREEDKPIFLSVGYSTCYWCHVMERESFSDLEIAEVMNREMVSVKVDREERPDVDEIYMAATQLLTHEGGWPNSVFLTPDLEPFFAGTYFPPRDRHGRPGFLDLLQRMARAWKERRPEIQLQVEELMRVMRRYLEGRGAASDDLPGPEPAELAAAALKNRFDAVHGGFGQAPKFPTPANLYLLLDRAKEDREAWEMVGVTLDRMARGGVFDQLGGGFHRYATDPAWVIPHFEKMLYDNALLLEVYALWIEGGELEVADAPEADEVSTAYTMPLDEAARVVRETAAFLDRELSDPHGGFHSALDAETDGREGAFYVWTREQLDEAVGPEDATFLAPLLGFSGSPFFEGHHYVLHLPGPLEEQAAMRHTSREGLLADLDPLRQVLLEARARRPDLLVDDKVMTDWNGMAVRGLAVAGRVLGDADMIARATRAAEFVEGELRDAEGRLLHTWRDGEARVAAMLGDYAWWTRGLLGLHRATGQQRWLECALITAAEMERVLGDERGGYAVAQESPDLLFRSREIFDGALPAGNGVVALNFLELAEATGDPAWRAKVAALLRAFAATAGAQPDAVKTFCLAARRFESSAG